MTAYEMLISDLSSYLCSSDLLVTALEAAGVEPEVMFAEFGRDQFEVTCAPADPVTAADRAVVIREIVRETARSLGWRASFAPKTAADGVGNEIGRAHV